MPSLQELILDFSFKDKCNVEIKLEVVKKKQLLLPKKRLCGSKKYSDNAPQGWSLQGRRGGGKHPLWEEYDCLL